MKRAVMYLRVSTVDQTTANQERELRAVAERAGWEVVKFGLDRRDRDAEGVNGQKQTED
jgi:DNA invertase Pin-like site-specific DNA recombinase